MVDEQFFLSSSQKNMWYENEKKIVKEKLKIKSYEKKKKTLKTVIIRLKQYEKKALNFVIEIYFH